jgi:hypothetical protein
MKLLHKKPNFLRLQADVVARNIATYVFGGIVNVDC